MLSIIIDVSKYIFALLAVSYAGTVLIGLVGKNRFLSANIYTMQVIITLTLHFLGYIVLFTQNENNLKYAALYGAELVYFIVVYMVYGIFYKNASRLLVNNMCMLLVMGFIMITRYKLGVLRGGACAACSCAFLYRGVRCQSGAYNRRIFGAAVGIC